MTTYFRRMVKYLLYLAVLFSVIFTIMNLTGTVAVQFNDLSHMFSSSSGKLLAGAFILLGLLHPVIGYVKREMVVNPSSGRDRVIAVMEMCGYEMIEESGSKMQFRAKSKLKRLAMLFEDEILINKDDLPATISGNRRAVTTILFRMESHR